MIVYGFRDGRVVRAIRWRKRDRQRVRSGGGNSACRRGIHECARYRGSRIQLSSGECRAIDDACRVSPGDHRSCLRNRQRDGLGHSGVVRRVGRSKGDRESISARRRNNTGSRGINEIARHRRSRIELGCGECGPVDDACRSSPGDGGSRLRNSELDRCGNWRVVRSVGRCEGDRERVGTSRGDATRCRSINERPRYGGGGVQLCARESRAIGDACRVSPGNYRRCLTDNQCNGLGDRGVVRRVGRCKRDRERVGTSRRDATRRGSVHESSRYRGCRIELSGRQRGSVSDVRRIIPSDHRSRLSDNQRNGLGDGGVVRRVGRREGNRKRVGTGRRNNASCRRIDESARNRRRRIQLSRRECRSVNDVRRIIPGNNRPPPA